MTEQLALSVSAMVSGALSGRGMETMEGFPEEVTSWLTQRVKQDLKGRRGPRWVFQGEKGALAWVQSEGGHSRHVSDSFKAQAKNVIFLHIFCFCAECFCLFYNCSRKHFYGCCFKVHVRWYQYICHLS